MLSKVWESIGDFFFLLFFHFRALCAVYYNDFEIILCFLTENVEEEKENGEKNISLIAFIYNF